MSSRARHLKKAAVPMRVRASLVSCLVAGLIAGGLREGVAHAASGDSDRQRDRAQIVDWMAAAYGVSWEYSLAVLEAARKLDPQQYTVRRGAPTQHRAIESAGLVSTEASNGRLVVSHIDSALRWEMFTDRRRGRAKGNRHRINDTVYTAGVRRGRGGGEWIKIKRQGPLLRVRHELTPLSFHAGPGRPDEIVTMSHEFELGRGNNPVDGPYLRPQVRGILLQGQFGGEQSPVAPIIRSTASFGDGIGNMLDWMPWAFPAAHQAVALGVLETARSLGIALPTYQQQAAEDRALSGGQTNVAFRPYVKSTLGCLLGLQVDAQRVSQLVEPEVSRTPRASHPGAEKIVLRRDRKTVWLGWSHIPIIDSIGPGNPIRLSIGRVNARLYEAKTSTRPKHPPKDLWSSRPHVCVIYPPRNHPQRNLRLYPPERAQGTAKPK